MNKEGCSSRTTTLGRTGPDQQSCSVTTTEARSATIPVNGSPDKPEEGGADEDHYKCWALVAAPLRGNSNPWSIQMETRPKYRFVCSIKRKQRFSHPTQMSKYWKRTFRFMSENSGRGRTCCRHISAKCRNVAAAAAPGTPTWRRKPVAANDDLTADVYGRRARRGWRGRSQEDRC